MKKYIIGFGFMFLVMIICGVLRSALGENIMTDFLIGFFCAATFYSYIYSCGK